MTACSTSAPTPAPPSSPARACHENYFNVAWQNDNLHEAMGQYVVQQRLFQRLHPGAQLSGGQRRAGRLQALLHGRSRGRDLQPARPDRLCRRDRRDPRGGARFDLLLPAGRHGHRLHEAVRPVRPGRAGVRPGLLVLPGHPRRGRRRRARRQEHLAMVEGPGQSGQRRSSSPPSRKRTAGCRRSTPARATMRRA